MPAKKKPVIVESTEAVRERIAAQKAEQRFKDEQKIHEAAVNSDNFANYIETQSRVAESLCKVAQGIALDEDDADLTGQFSDPDMQENLATMATRLANVINGYQEAVAYVKWLSATCHLDIPWIGATVRSLDEYHAILDGVRKLYTGKHAQPDAIETWYRAADRSTIIVTMIHDTDFEGHKLPDHKVQRDGLRYWINDRTGEIQQGSFFWHASILSSRIRPAIVR